MPEPRNFSEPDYRHDTEFSKLLARRADVDLTIAALEVARDAYPEMQFDETLRWFDLRANYLREKFAASVFEREALEALCEELGRRQELTGSDAAFDDPDASYLNRIVVTGQGIPLSLSLVYMGVAERAGLTLSGVSAPQHFLSRCETAEGPLFVDAFTPGRILTASECIEWLSDLTEMTDEQIRPFLEPAGPRMILVRMLNNLKVVHAKHENWDAAWKVQHRLMTLKPGSYQERRDMGILSVHADRTLSAIKLLTGCLRNCPQEEREVLKEHLEMAHSSHARWN
ncbi:SirB1 family protein [Thalassoroseus pseudoceratinae]|uniref:SirB1 family protein n=1 Tax=Thalassoroseus pseudoceratinae TaxID=2713176 RepID=UPI001422A9E9|nr:tetratricopeptide repeat protein [Thalassoroseus pseudoceratinae]